jgi:prophage antirepressor-like protein
MTSPGTAIATFIYSDHEIRIAGDPDEPWFVLSDVCDILGITNVTRTASRVDPEDKRRDQIQTEGRGEQTMIMINDRGLFDVVLSSRSDAARPFKRWVIETLRELQRSGYKLMPAQQRKAALMSMTISQALNDVRAALAAHKYESVERHLDRIHITNQNSLVPYAGKEALREANKELTANPYLLGQEF